MFSATQASRRPAAIGRDRWKPLDELAARLLQLDGLHAAAITAVGFMILYLPVFTILPGGTLASLISAGVYIVSGGPIPRFVNDLAATSSRDIG